MRFWFALICVLLGGASWAQDPRGIDFRRADSIAATLRGYSLIDRRTLTDLLTRDLPTPEEKFRAIYRWISDNVSYDLSTGLKNQRMRQRLKDPVKLREWQQEVALLTWRNLVNEKKTVCTGYAFLLHEMAARVGIECLLIDGYSRNASSNIGGEGFVNHSWNAVKFSGQWYLCDPTWSAGYFSNGGGRFIHRFEPAYFLTKPEVFVLNHYPVDPQWSLLEESQRPTKTEFLNGPLIYGAAVRKGIKPVSKDLRIAIRRGHEVKLELQNIDPTATVKVTLSQQNGNENPLDFNRDNLAGNRTQLTCSSTDRGKFGLHVMVDGDYVATYELVVE